MPSTCNGSASAGFPASGDERDKIKDLQHFDGHSNGEMPRPPPHSLASATTGSRRAAERAGMKPNSTPIRLDETNAAMIVAGE
jgi:hypothetical protein